MVKALVINLGTIVFCCALTGCFRFPAPAALRLTADPARLRQGPPPSAAADAGSSTPLVLDPVRIEPETATGYAALPTSITRIYDRPPTPLSLADVVLFDLANNRQIEIRRYDARIAQCGLPAARGIYDLLLTGNYHWARNERQGGAPAFAGSRTWPRSGELALSQLLPTGATVSVTFDSNRPATNRYAAQTTFELRQPLLQGLGWVVTNAEIRIAALTGQAGEADFRAEAETQLAAALDAYWDLIGAIQELKVNQISYAAAADLHRVNQAKYDVGLISIADLLQTEAATAARYGLIVTARQRVRDVEDQLKRRLLMADTDGKDKGAKRPDWDPQFLPTQAIAWREMTVDGGAAVARALERRPELTAARIDVAAARERLAVARNATLPVLDFVGSLVPNGVSQGTRDGGFDEAFRNMRGGEAISYILGLEFSFPLQNRGARYRQRQAKARLAQAEERLKDTEDQVTQEVRQAARDYASARQRIDVSQSLIVSEEANLETDRLRLEVGFSTTFRVLQFQQDLANAQLQHVRAVIDANKAAIALERAQGTLLESYGIRDGGEIPPVPRER